MKVIDVVDCNIMPIFPTIDHIFRYYEPENSFYKINIPPLKGFEGEF